MEEKVKEVGNITIFGARVRYRNFSAKPDKFEPIGTRFFSVFLDNDLAERLALDGWNIKWKAPVHPQDPPQAYLKVYVRFSHYPPKIKTVTAEGKRSLEEKDVSKLDWADVEKWNLIIRPYHWDVAGKRGIKAMLQSMTVYIAEDELEAELRDVPDLDSPDGDG